MSIETEKRTEAIARQLCKDRGLPLAMAELLLGEAYQLLYFGNKKTLAQIEAKIKKLKASRKKP